MKINKLLKELKNVDINSKIDILPSTKNKRGFSLIITNSDTSENKSIMLVPEVKKFTEMLKMYKTDGYDNICIRYNVPSGMILESVYSEINASVDNKDKTIYLFDDADFGII